MAMPKIPALLLKVLLCGLLLCGCGGQPLSKREIVRAVFFAQQGEHYSVCLLLADQNAPEGESAFKTASAAAPTPAQALENAAATLPGTVYYGLLDAAALPAGADWEQAQEIGMLLYDRAQPAPELSVFLLDSADHDWQQDAQGLYERMQAIEDRYKVTAACSSFSPSTRAAPSRPYRKAAGMTSPCWLKRKRPHLAAVQA